MNNIDNPSQTYLENLDQIKRVISRLARRNGLTKEETEDFQSSIHVKMIEDNYLVLRKYRGESGLGSYLASVVHHFFLDYRNAQLGKWRPSRAALRLGDAAVMLERLTHRDQYSFDEACQIMHTNHDLKLSKKQLTDLYEQLPARGRRVKLGGEALEGLEGGQRPADEQLVLREESRDHQQAVDAVRDALNHLDEEDRVLVKMHYMEGATVAGLARAMGYDQRKLYRRLNALCNSLKSALSKLGIGNTDPGDLIN